MDRAGPSSASLPSTNTSDVSETDVSNERSTAGSSGIESQWKLLKQLFSMQPQ